MFTKAWKTIKPVVLSVLVLAIAFGAGFYARILYDSRNAEVVNSSDSEFNLQLPGEVEKRVVTIEEVQSKLVEISEFSTYSGEYTVDKAVEYSRYLFGDEKNNKDGIKIPGTTNSIDVHCNGIVKVGYDFNDIVIKVDNTSGKIYISLPQAKVNDNYVIWDTVTCNESNNILNPIDFSQYQQLINELEILGLTDVESKGIYQSAEDSIKKVITTALAGFDGFEVIYM